MNNLKSCKSAVVIKIGNRFFSSFGKKGNVLTAHSLAGAKLFLPVFQADLSRVCDRLDDKFKLYDLLIVNLSADRFMS